RLKPIVGTTNRSMADDLRQVDLNGEANKFKKEQRDHCGRRSVNSFHIKRTRFSAHTGDPVFPGAHAIRAVSAGRFKLSDVRPPHITSRIRCRFPSLARWES